MFLAMLKSLFVAHPRITAAPLTDHIKALTKNRSINTQGATRFELSSTSF